MRRFCISVVYILLLPILLLALSLKGFAIAAPTEPADDTSAIPEDFSFSVSNVCSGHEYFDQVSVDESGMFALLSRYTNIEENQKLVYRLCYVDIYSDEGDFITELSFFTEQDVAVEFRHPSVYLHFYDRTLIFDLDTGHLYGTMTEPGLMIDNGTYSRLQETKFCVGQWQYSCKKSFHGYTQLERTNGSATEVLVSFHGNGYSLWNTIVPAVLLGTGLLLLRRRYDGKRG